MLYRVLAIACLALTPTSGLETISSNDNRTPAGKLRGDVLSVRLTAAPGVWYPEAERGPGHQVYALAKRVADYRIPVRCSACLRAPRSERLSATGSAGQRFRSMDFTTAREPTPCSPCLRGRPGASGFG